MKVFLLVVLLTVMMPLQIVMAKNIDESVRRDAQVLIDDYFAAVNSKNDLKIAKSLDDIYGNRKAKKFIKKNKPRLWDAIKAKKLWQKTRILKNSLDDAEDYDSEKVLSSRKRSSTNRDQVQRNVYGSGQTNQSIVASSPNQKRTKNSTIVRQNPNQNRQSNQGFIRDRLKRLRRLGSR